jgi:hypothetical protein
MCEKNNGNVPCKLRIETQNDQLCNMYITENPLTNSKELLLFSKGVSGIVLFGTHRNKDQNVNSNPEKHLRFYMYFYDQNNEEINNLHYGIFTVSYAEIIYKFGLDRFSINRNDPTRDLLKTQLQWEVKQEYTYFTEFLNVRNVNKLLIGRTNFIEHFQAHPTTDNPYICLI